MINQKIIAWYLLNKRDLPWRNTKDPYKVWLSEIILQQTRVAQGLPYYQKFIKKFPNVFELAQASEQEILKLWQGLGYYTRARNLHFTAKTVVNQHNGSFPNTYAHLLKLKGIGEYTAAAIASFCYKEPIAVLDGNVYRVLSRIFGIETPINSTEAKKIFKELASKNLDAKQPDVYNQAIMEFGALHCTPANPQCQSCPIQTDCIAFQTGKVNHFPVKTSKIKVKNRYLHYFLLTQKDTLILEKRIGKGIWKNLYQLPLIETPKKITINTTVIDKKLQKQGINIEGEVKLINQITHKLSHQHLHISFWRAKITQKTTASIPFYDIKKYPMPIVIAKFLENSIL